MKAVLLSIQPKWCELIASGKKTVEVRKSKPKLETPFKCYIYCTKDNTFAEKTLRGFDENGKAIYHKANKGKVIGEFVCDEIDKYAKAFFDEQEERDTYDIARFIYHSQIKYNDLCAYVGLGDFYAWHITDLVIYDKPRELSEFMHRCNTTYCADCLDFCEEGGSCVGLRPLKRPFQSWRYVEVQG